MVSLAVQLPAVILAASSFAPGFNASQSHMLSTLSMPIVLPSQIPQGFHVAQVDVSRGKACANCEDYRVTYTSGSALLEFSGSTWTAGGDADENAFDAQFNSRLFGPGVVSMIRDVAFDRSHLHSNCLTAFARKGNATSFFLTLNAKYYYAVRACDSALSPSDVARIIESAGIIHR